MPLQFHSCPVREEQDQRQSPSQGGLHQQTTFSFLEVAHGKQLVSLRIQGCDTLCIHVLVSSQLAVLQPDHRSTKAQNSSHHTALCPTCVSQEVVPQSVITPVLVLVDRLFGLSSSSLRPPLLLSLYDSLSVSLSLSLSFFLSLSSSRFLLFPFHWSLSARNCTRTGSLDCRLRVRFDHSERYTADFFSTCRGFDEAATESSSCRTISCCTCAPVVNSIFSRNLTRSEQKVKLQPYQTELKIYIREKGLNGCAMCSGSGSRFRLPWCAFSG